jgi:hypothetical protein
MPIHVEQMTSEVIALGEDFPLSQDQVEMLVRLVLKRLEQKQRDAYTSREATSLRASVVPPTTPGNRSL